MRPEVVKTVVSGETREASADFMTHVQSQYSSANTYELIGVITKDGQGTLTVSQGYNLNCSLNVREGELYIGNGTEGEHITLLAQPHLSDSPTITIGGNNASMVLDNATFKYNVHDKNNRTSYVSAIAIGNSDGAGSLELKNNSVLYTSQSFFAYTVNCQGHVQGTYAGTEGEALYTGGIKGQSSLIISGGSKAQAGITFYFADIDITVDGQGSVFEDGVRCISSDYVGWLGDADGSGSTDVVTNVTIQNGGTWTSRNDLTASAAEGATTNITVTGEGSTFNSERNTKLGDDGRTTTTNLTVTDKAVANITDLTVGTEDGKATSTVTIGEDSTLNAGAVKVYAGGEIINNGAINEGKTKKVLSWRDDSSMGLSGGYAATTETVVAGITMEGGNLVNTSTLTTANLTINSGTVTSTGEIKLSDTLTLNGGKLSLTVSSANLKRAYVSAAALQTGEAPAIELVATENLKAGKYHILSVGETPESEGGEEQPPAVTSTSGEGASGEGESTTVSNPIQYTMIGVDGMTTTWEGGDLYLTLENQLMIWRDPLSDALQAANWGVFHSSQAFTGTLWAQRPAATCIIVDEGTLLTAWGSAYSSFISQSGDSKFNGADYSIYGASMGVEAPLSKHRIVGAAFGYDIGKVSPGTTTDVDQTTVHVAAYGRAAVWCLGNQSNIALDWSVAYGRTTSEHDAIPGDWTQNSFQIDARATYSHSINSRTAVSAFVGAQYFTQEDASNARADVDGITNLRVMLGTGIHRTVTDRTTVFGEAALRHDIVRDNPHVMLDGFDYGTGANPGRFGGSISAGVEHRLNDDWKIRANYSYEVADDQNEHSFGAGASYSF